MRAALIGIALVVLSGCAITHSSGGDWGVYPISKAGEEVQTLTVSSIGLKIIGSSPTANGMPEIDFGYQRAQITRIPAFETGWTVPAVSSGAQVDANTGARVGETLEIGTYAQQPTSPRSLREMIFGSP